MGTLENFIQGTCMTMCPEEEVYMRERERLIHPLEMVPGTEKHSRPKADINRMVKAFSRSAAGKAIDNKSLLRPASVLLHTVGYLLFDVINVDTCPWHVVYDFITDRLMAVRQDMVVQNISRPESISILQPVVRFHAYAAYRLFGEDIKKFDPTLNKKHLQECLKKLLHLYDGHEELLSNAQNLSNYSLVEDDEYLIRNRSTMEALYILLNLGHKEALMRYLSLPETYRSGRVLDAFNLSTCFAHGNYVRCCRILAALPPLLSLVAAVQLPEIRRTALMVMSLAYHAKNLRFDVSDIQKYLLYRDYEDVLEDCKYYGLTVDSGAVYFNKMAFKSDVPPRQKLSFDVKINQQSILSLVLDED